ncbi:hypothetical protein M0R36_09045 [bacterium]|jgi:sRNA-binding regulator protein Hfq|nr:hypothetical protein [bacterium]
MRKTLINIILFFLLSIPALPSSADIIYLKNGGELRCSIIQETDDYLILQVKNGKLKILKSSIEEIEKTQPLPLKQSEPKPVSPGISNSTIEEVDSLIKGDVVPEPEAGQAVEETVETETDESQSPALPAEDAGNITEPAEPPAEKENSVDESVPGENPQSGFKARFDSQKIEDLQIFFQDNIALVISIALLVFLVILFISMALNGIYIKLYAKLILKMFIPFGRTIVFQLKFFAFEIFIGIVIGALSALLGFGGLKGFLGIMFLWLFFAVILIWFFFSLANREFGFSFMQTLFMILIYIALYAAFSFVLNLILSGLFVSITT